jgi:hypothetical protein
MGDGELKLTQSRRRYKERVLFIEVILIAIFSVFIGKLLYIMIYMPDFFTKVLKVLFTLPSD